jgi:hypothetical protein
LGVGFACPATHRTHLRISEVATGPYLWIESGVTSLPLDAHVAPVTTAGYVIDAHLHPKLSLLQASLFDVVFVAQLDLLHLFESHPSAHWLPLAAPKRFLSAQRGSRYDASFVGNLWPSTPRAAIMRAVSEAFITNDWTRHHSVEEMAEIYAHSRIVVNPAVNGDLNMRFFEGLACGAIVLMPEVLNGANKIAEEGRDFFTGDFSDIPALVDTIRNILSSGADGSKGREVIAAGHTYDHRILFVAETLAKAERAAPVRSMTSDERARLLLSLSREYEDIRLLGAVARSNPREVARDWRPAIDSLRSGLWKWSKERVKSTAPGVAAMARRRIPSRPGK